VEWLGSLENTFARLLFIQNHYFAFRRFEQPAITQFGRVERLLRLRPIALHVSILMIAAYNFVPAHFIPRKLCLTSAKRLCE